MSYIDCVSVKSRDAARLWVCEPWLKRALALGVIVIVIVISHGVGLCLLALFAKELYEQSWHAERNGAA